MKLPFPWSLGDRPIKQKLTAMLMAASGAVVLLTCSAFVLYELFTFRTAARENLATIAQVLAANSTGSLAFDNEQDASEVLQALHAERRILAAGLYKADGRLFVSYHSAQPDPAVPPAPGTDGYRFERGRLIGVQPVVEGNGRRLGTLYLESDLTAVYRRLELYGLIAFGVLGASLVLAYLLSNVLQAGVSRPILALAETARAISERQDYSVRAPELGRDELGSLTGAFNQMLARIEDQDRALRESKEKLQHYATELEQRVAERTHALQESNEALRRNASELLASNTELDAFAYSVSHDLRAPLRSIDGFSHVLLEDYSAQLDQAGRDALQRVRAASQRMATLIDDLLKLARVTRAEMRTEVVDLSRMAREIATEIQRAMPERKVDLAIAPRLEARGDSRLLRVALENLLRNSWKYTGKQPQPRIEFAAVEANGKRGFMVRDNGAGFDMKYADKLFGVFQRLHSAAEFEGTGIGLATVRRIITRHGGRIWAEGAVDQGATFYFTL
jgi:signal transduction histidine kinase